MRTWQQILDMLSADFQDPDIHSSLRGVNNLYCLLWFHSLALESGKAM